MNKLQLLREPGYIYDLNFIFFLKFNWNLCIEKYLPEDDKKEENIKYLNDILIRFGDISDDLYLFFHTLDTGRAFLPSCYFKSYKERITTTYDFKFIIKEIADQDKFIKNVISFYFYDLDDETVEKCRNSLSLLASYIKASNYSDEDKRKLYEFFIDPSSYIQTLQYELISKEILLSEHYKANYQKIIDMYNETTVDILNVQLKDVSNINFDGEDLYVSYCLLNKFSVYFYSLSDGYLCILGSDYSYIVESKKEETSKLSLNDFGSALCEESRTKILEYLFKQGEATCKDVEKEFEFSGSTAYHHLTIMMRSGLVKSRSEKKTVYYSLNKKYIYNVIDVLEKYVKGN